MPEPPTPPRKLQWKWVGISLLMYIVFYFLPLSLVPGGFLSASIVTKASTIFIGIWSFAGLFIIGATAGLISKGVTIKEPAIAAVCLAILWLVAIQIRINIAVRLTKESLIGLLIAFATVFLVALVGAWFGEFVQKVSKSKTHDAD